MLMYTPISIQNKKHFMRWFLRNFTLKRLEASWILNYLVKQDKLLSKVSFVHDAKFCPRAIILTSDCSDEIPFLFYKQHIITTDIDKFFHDIRLHQDEHIYIQLNFKGANQNPFYAGVLEENPFIPSETIFSKQDQDISESLLGDLLCTHQFKKLNEDINQALDEKNEDKFNVLVTELQELKKAHHIY